MRYPALLLALLLGGCASLAPLPPPLVTLVVDETRGGFHETGITVGDGAWYFLHGGKYTCYIYSAAWTDGNVDVEWIVAGTKATPTTIADVDVATLVNATADAYGILAAGDGSFYRIEVEGSDTINWQCWRYAR